MAKINTSKRNVKKRTKRPGIHSKTKQSINKNATNYVKKYVGQGK